MRKDPPIIGLVEWYKPAVRLVPLSWRHYCCRDRSPVSIAATVSRHYCCSPALSVTHPLILSSQWPHSSWFLVHLLSSYSRCSSVCSWTRTWTATFRSPSSPRRRSRPSSTRARASSRIARTGRAAGSGLIWSPAGGPGGAGSGRGLTPIM